MNRKFAIGCAVVLLIIAGVIGWGMSRIPKLVESGRGWLQTQIAEQQRIKAFEMSWMPISPKPDASWFPAKVGNASLQSSAPFKSLTELNVTREGYGAIYSTETGRTEISVVAANDLEQETLTARIKAALTAGTTSKYESHSGTRHHIRTGGDDHTRIWWVKGWLFIFRDRAGEDPDEFSKEYLRAIARPGLASPKPVARSPR